MQPELGTGCRARLSLQKLSQDLGVNRSSGDDSSAPLDQSQRVPTVVRGPTAVRGSHCGQRLAPRPDLLPPGHVC